MRYRRRGMILALVLVVIALLALAAGTFSYLMVAERKAIDVSVRRAQARASADSGVEMARAFIVQESDIQDQYGGWYDNELLFRGRLLVADQLSQDVGQFTIVAPRLVDGVAEGVRYGLEDESTRLNLNALMALEKKVPSTGRQLLMGLPGMTEDIADSILDWMDEDDEIREFGAEAEYYITYAPKNGPLDSIAELLLVRGIRENPLLLFGCDVNRNASIDAGEPDSQSIVDVDNSDGSMNRGWAAYLTLHSFELNLNPDGEKKINLNQNNLEQLYDQLEEKLDSEQATFIVAYRLGSDAGENEPTRSIPDIGELDLTQQPQRSLTTVLELIGTNVKLQLKSDQGDQGLALESPFPDEPGAMDSYLPTLLDEVAVVTSSPLVGRININQAPRTLLMAIPGMTEEIAESILGSREPDLALALPSRRHETWILSEGLVTLDQMKTLMPFVCGGGSVYRAQVIGFFEQGGPAVRIEAVLDSSKTPAQVLFWRDISNLGRGYALDILRGGMGSGQATGF